MDTYTVRPKLLMIALGTLLMLALSVAFTSSVGAHGYVNSPESRGLLCSQGVNVDCGDIMYEPQSLEAPGNFPEAGPADGNIAGAGNAFPELNVQTDNRWEKVEMSSGAFTFEWTLTARHSTEKWDYYITKEGWDPNSPLERSDLELFCTVNDGGQIPSPTMQHNCEIPERSGYHIILAYWEVADTPNAFYNVIDANFDGDYVDPIDPVEPDPEPEVPVDPEEPENTGTWNNETVYLAGDQVTYNGSSYEARWWTLGERPGESDAWKLIDKVDESDTGNEHGNNATVWALVK